MLTRKSGFMALVLGATVLAACEKKDGDIILPPTPVPVTVTIAPKPVPNLPPSGTVQLVAVVTGTTNTAVTWSVLSGTSATVSASGLVTASATVQGVTTVQAQSQADPNAKDVVTITVQPGAGGGPSQVTIASVTQFGTIFPVNPGNVFGIIDITANLDVPSGTTGSVRFDIVDAAGNAVRADICAQQFTSGTSAETAIESQVPVTVVCTFNTASLDSAGLALLLNGTYRVRVRVLNAAGTTQLAAATGQPLVFNNADMLIMTVRTDSMTGPQTDPNGLSYRAGSVIVHIRPAIFTSTQASPLGAITSMNVTVSSSGPGASWYATAPCLADNDTDGTSDWIDISPACPVATSLQAATRIGNTNLWRAVFPASGTGNQIGGAGVGGIEDRAGLAVAPAGVVNVSGNNFPICSAAQAALGNCVQTFAVNFPTVTPGTVPVPITAQNPLRVDNLAPRVLTFDIRGNVVGGPAAIACGTATCFANANFALAQSTPAATGIAAQSAASTAGYTNLDFGVDKQTTAFAVGTAAAFTAGTGFANNVTTFGAAALAETTISIADPTCVAPACLPSYVVRATAVDALGNDTIVFAGNAGTAVATTATAHTLGFDKTAPFIIPGTIAFAPPVLNSTDTAEVATTIMFSIRDSSAVPAAPAGFSGTGAPPVVGTGLVVAYNRATGTAGANPGTQTVACIVIGATGGSCTLTIPDAQSVAGAVDAYYEAHLRVIDATVPGGNVSADSIRTYLDDETLPQVAGVTSPSSIFPTGTTTFTADVKDNVELGDFMAALGYPNTTAGAVNYYVHGGRVSLGTFGPTALDTAAVATQAYTPILASLQSVGATCTTATLAACPTNGAGDNGFVNAVNFAVRDMAGRQVGTVCPAPGLGTDGNFTQGPPPSSAVNAPVNPNGSCLERENNNIQPNVIVGFGTSTPFNFGTLAGIAGAGDWQFIQNIVCRNTTAILTPPVDPVLQPATRCGAPPANSTIVTLQAEADGPQGTFQNPFTNGVQFYILDASSRWILIPGTPVVQAFDDNVVNARRYIFTLTTTTATVPIGSTVRAVGLRGNAGLVANTSDRVVP